MTRHYEIHEIADRLPPMTDEEYQRLKDDVRGLGVIEPIVLLDGKILDGRHRYKACVELGIECPTRKLNNMSPADIVASLNLIRRHLSPSQVAMVFTRLKEPFMLEAIKRKLDGLKQNHAKAAEEEEEEEDTVGITGGQRTEQGRAAELLAKKAGVSKCTMERALLVDEEGTEEQQTAVVKGEATVSAMAKKIREARPAKTEEPGKPCGPMNRVNENIGWAQYSWNPVFGCKMGCAYCYSKEIADRCMGGDFTPRFHPERLAMPDKTRPRANDANNRVFVCSMADLFGDWVPQEWIDRVLEVCEKCDEWEYLFLTKNPKRLPAIKFPSNCWVGSTIDTQAREKAVADAFARMGTDKLFVSCEPLLERVTLSTKLLKTLKLVIIGALSKGSHKEQPPHEWVESLLSQAREAGAMVWFKDNLIFRPQEFPDSKKEALEL